MDTQRGRVTQVQRLGGLQIWTQVRVIEVHKLWVCIVVIWGDMLVSWVKLHVVFMLVL